MDDSGRMERAPLSKFGGPAILALLGGVLLAMCLPSLPARGWLWPLLVLALLAWWLPGQRYPRVVPRLRVPMCLLGAVGVGFAWAAFAGHAAMSGRMPPALEGQDQVLVVRVDGLVREAPGRLQLDARVLSEVGAVDGSDAADMQGRRLRLAWYGPAPAIEPGETWRIEARLRRPRGLLNPGGHDSERHAVVQRLGAVGYVRAPERAERLGEGGGLDAWRSQRAARIAGSGESEGMRFVQALALGDTRRLDTADWEVLRATGLSHLLAISGFHVGVVAGFAALLGAGLYRLWPVLGLRLPRPQGAAVAGLLAAVAYAAAAGFALPTVRALLMVGVVLLARLWRRHQPPGRSLALALLAILAIDPLAVLSAGFWLSFLGVAWLLWCLPREREAGYLRPLLQAQLVASLGLLPMTAWFFGQASLAGPIANLVGIPVITLLVVPLSLLGLLADTLWAGAGAWPWRAAAAVMDAFWPAMHWLAARDGALAWLPEPGPLSLLLALAGAFWLLMPRGVPARPLALLLFLPLLWPAADRPGAGEVDIAMFDAGQGLAVLVRTRHHALLYDAGPGIEGRFDTGRTVVVPGLRALGLRRLDEVMLSHGDADHAGGLAAVLAAFPGTPVSAPAGWRAGLDPCLAGQTWTWDGVVFRVLHPPRHFPYLGNEASCVLRIEATGGAALLAGDIGAVVERRLLREQPDGLSADILVVPHHGSRTSSSAGFVDAVAPRFALFGVGHRNRFGFPHPDVQARYDTVGAESLQSSAEGFIRLRIAQNGTELRQTRRRDHRRWWHEP